MLGAGGVAGIAWHAGVLAGLQDATGFDARTADVIVGTSAGSITGATLRAGVPAADLFALATGQALTPEGAALHARIRTSEGFTATARSSTMRRPANPGLLRALAPWDRRPLVALAGLLPAGAIDTGSIAVRVDELAGLGGRWPEQPLWIVAVDLGSGRRVVFGRDEAPQASSLGAAVAASSAVPGLFAPVVDDGVRYIDGGVHSTTNADLAVGLGHDLVIVSAPMAGRWRSLRAHPASMSRTSARVSLDREVSAIRRDGTRVLVLQPGPDDTPIMDGAAMDPRRRRPIAEQARKSTIVSFARPQVADVVGLLRS